MRFSRLLIGLPMLLLPMLANAAVDCSQLDDVEAISKHYVQRALDRADDGIAYATEAETNDDFFPLYLDFWARSIGSSYADMANLFKGYVKLSASNEQIALEPQDLSTVTACLRFDQILLECKIAEVSAALDAELERGSFVAIMRLQSLLKFLQQRLYHLSAGGTDDRYADASWEQRWLFDEEKPEELEEPLCPFHSDYVPPRMTGYGCDVETLDTINAYQLGFVQAERDGLAKIEEEIDAFREIIPLIQSLAPQDQDFEAPEPVADRGHVTLIGCQEKTGICSDLEIECESDEYCASQGAGTCSMENEPLPETTAKRALRGPFSYPKEHLSLLTDFVEKRIRDGFARTYPDDWAKFADLPEGGEAAKDREDDDAMLGMRRTSLRIFFRAVSGIQGRQEGTIFPEAADSQMEIANSLSDMRASIGELSRLASQKTGVRAFVTDFAYFLRRTCVFRPCQRQLEQVIRIGLEDACFPYTNGEFLKDTEENPRWKTCAEAACIQVEGANLPGNCQEILPR